MLWLYGNKGDLWATLTIIHHPFAIHGWCLAVNEENPSEILTCLPHNGWKCICLKEFEAFFKLGFRFDVVSVLIVAKKPDVETCQYKMMKHVGSCLLDFSFFHHSSPTEVAKECDDDIEAVK